MDELPPNAPALALTGSIAGDAMADTVEATDLFDQFAGMFALVRGEPARRVSSAWMRLLRRSRQSLPASACAGDGAGRSDGYLQAFDAFGSLKTRHPLAARF